MSDNSASTLAPPVITTCTTTYIAGTESTAGTTIEVLNASQNKTAVSNMPVTVQNGAWSMVPDNPPSVGDRVYARAILPSGATSDPSAMSTVIDGVPASPVITTCTTELLAGTEATPNTLVNVYDKSQNRSPLNINPIAVTDGKWNFVPATWAQVGDAVYARATAIQPNGALGNTSDPSAISYLLAGKPVIEVYTGQYFSGTETTPGTYVNVFNAGKYPVKPVMNSPVPVENGGWSMIADNPASAGDTVFALAYVKLPDGQFDLASGPSEHRVVSASAVVPIPPEVDNYATGTSISGTTYPNTYINLTVSAPSGTLTSNPAVFSKDGDWSIDLDSGTAAGTTYRVTANYPGGAQSDTYVKQQGREQDGFLIVNSVGATAMSGVAPQTGQQILAWRSSDGKKMVDQVVSSSTAHFTATYLNGLVLGDDDSLNVVSAFPGYGSMTPYNSKPEGYSE